MFGDLRRQCGIRSSKAMNYRRFRPLFQGAGWGVGRDNPPTSFFDRFFASMKFVSLRIKLGAAFAALSLAVGAGVVAMLVMQLEAIERAALLEAEHFANVIALSTSSGLGRNRDLLETYVERLDSIYKRDVVIVDQGKKGVADANKSEVGEIFAHDRGNEVALTMADGKVRTFVEQNEFHVDGAKQLVVPLRKDQERSDSPIVGAVIVEYTQIYEDLFEAERP